MPNRLADETSPYLLQHADNPVDWYPWGAEAMERARREDLPILLSVGYSACHWCHVMEHESFEDEATAQLMNERFVNVKVDREERPDVDSLYMTAVQRMTGHGGWPMTVFLTPEGEPFYGGTYFPPEPRHGMPSFRQVLTGVSDAWRERRDQVRDNADELRATLEASNTLRAETEALDAGLLDTAYRQIAARYDARHGGFGGAPKFPQPMALELLLRHWHRTGEPRALEMVRQTLRRMAAGGIYDQLGGGFHRYSVDARWLVPHFEKMLYDNALLARVYVHAYQATGDAELRAVAEQVLDYALREMRAPEGAFHSTQDADSEGEEGRFYVWTPEQVDAVLGPEDGPLFRRYYDVQPGGNWEGRSILHAPRPLAEVAAEAGVDEQRLRSVLERGREALYRARAERVWPGLDDKVLTSWNALMLRALAEAAWVLDRQDYADAAVASAEFLLTELRDPHGGVRRTWKAGRAKIDGFLEDHALLVDALVSLYGATWDARWVREARALADVMLERFWDAEREMLFDAAAGAERLVVRPRDPYDSATPSGNSAAVVALLRLAPLTAEPRYARVAATVLASMGGLLEQAPTAFAELLNALDQHLATPREVAVVGAPDAEPTRALLAVLRARYLPNTLRALRDPAARPDPAEWVPLLAARTPVGGAPAAYVCERFACRRPVTSAEELEDELRS